MLYRTVKMEKQAAGSNPHPAPGRPKTRFEQELRSSIPLSHRFHLLLNIS